MYSGHDKYGGAVTGDGAQDEDDIQNQMDQSTIDETLVLQHVRDHAALLLITRLVLESLLLLRIKPLYPCRLTPHKRDSITTILLC